MLASAAELTSFYKNKKILVTGGTGSIGEKVVESLLRYAPNRIIIFSKDDSRQYLMKQKYHFAQNIQYILGDIRDKDDVEYATRGIDYIFHAAALKQVPVCEDNPFEAVKTNVIGSENVIQAALSNRVRKVVNISTDKAINPSNTMGATKLLAEKLFSQANQKVNNDQTHFCSVRFGNVIGSRGSVLPIFLEQAKKGDPLTITDLQMTRFFMTIQQAAELTLKAAYYSKNGETFILRMNAFRIKELQQAVHMYCENEKIPLPKEKKIGIRPGEKLHEQLITEEEALHAWEDPELFVIVPMKSKHAKFLHFKKSSFSDYRSDQIKPLSAKQLLTYLYQVNRVF